MNWKEEIYEIYEKFLWSWDPIKSEIWFIGNEESWVNNFDDVKNKLLNYNIVNRDFKINLDKWILYKNNEFFTKSYCFIHNIDDINDKYEWESIYWKYYELLEWLNLIWNKPFYEVMENIFLWEYYYLPSNNNSTFKIIYDEEKNEFYNKEENKYKLENRVINLKNILDNNQSNNKIIIINWNSKDKLMTFYKLFWDFHKINDKIKWQYNGKNVEEKDIYYKKYNNSLFIAIPFIKYILNIDDLTIIIKKIMMK